MSSTGPRTVGLLTEPYLYEWQVRAIETLQAETDLEFSLVVTNAHNGDCEIDAWNTRDRVGLEDVRRFLAEVQRERAWTLVLAERTLARLAGDDASLWHRHAVADVDALEGTAHVRCAPRLEDGWAEFPEPVVARVQRECDVVVRFGFGLIRGGILDAPEYGVLSFHPADIRRYRGLGPPAIFYDDSPVAGVTLQRLEESIDGGEIVAFDETPTDDCATVWDVFDRTATLQIDLLTEGLENLCDPAFEPTTIPDDRLGEFYSRGQRRSLPFAGRVLARTLHGRLRRQCRGRLRSLVGSNETRTSDADPEVAESHDPHG